MLGCFGDSYNRDLDGIFFDLFSINSPKESIKKCFNFNFRYAGLQNGFQCWCGDKYGKFGSVESKNCYISCPKGNETCGGEFFNDIFEINNLSITKKILSSNNV